jgi:hypothetical protein
VFALPGEEVAVDGQRDVVVGDDESVAVALAAAEAQGLDVVDSDVALVVAALHDHLAAIGAVGPEATSPGNGSAG